MSSTLIVRLWYSGECLNFYCNRTEKEDSREILQSSNNTFLYKKYYKSLENSIRATRQKYRVLQSLYSRKILRELNKVSRNIFSNSNY